jgi:hypothetical protein
MAMKSDRFPSELLSLAGRSLRAPTDGFNVTANDMWLFEVFIYFTEAWGAINALVSILSVFIMYRMRIYKSRVMALIFWIGLLRIVYSISTMQVCPHLDITHGLEVDEFIMCVAVQAMFRYSTGLAIGSLINLLSITAAYVIFSSKGAHPSKASYIFWVAVPSLSIGIIFALQIINKTWDVDVEKGNHLVTSEIAGGMVGSGIKVALNIYDGLLALQAVIDIVCFRVLLLRMRTMKKGTEDFVYPLFQLVERLIWYPVMQLVRIVTMAPFQYIYSNLGCEYLYLLGSRDVREGRWVSIWIFLWAIFAPSGGTADTVIFFKVSVGAKETLQYYVEKVLRCGYVTEEARKKKKAVSWSKYSKRRGRGGSIESDRATSLTIVSDDYIPPAEREERRRQQQGGGGDDDGDDDISISEMSDADKDHRVEAMLGVEHEEGNDGRGGSHIIQISEWSTGAGIYRDEEEMERISEFLLADVDDDSDDADHDHDSGRSTTSAHEGGVFNNFFRSLRVSSGGGSRSSTMSMRNSNSDLVLGLNNESKKQVMHQLNEDELLDVIVRTRAKTTKQREREIRVLEQQFCETDGSSISSGGANRMSERVSEAEEGGGGGGVTSRRSSSQQQRNRQQQQQQRVQEQGGAMVGAGTVAFLEFFVESTEKPYHEMMREDGEPGASEIPDAVATAAAAAADHHGRGHGGGGGPSDAEVELQSVSVTRKEKKTVKIASDDGGTTQNKGSGTITNPLHSEV